LEGKAEHFDQYLGDTGKTSQLSMMIWRLRAKGKKLVLDFSYISLVDQLFKT